MSVVSEGSVTFVAGIWSFTSVCVNMVLKMACVDRRIGAMWTGVKDHETGFSDQTTDDNGILNASFCH